MLKSVKQAKDLEYKKVLYRVDFNVPIKNNKIIDDYKITKHLPTLKFLLARKCKIIILTHLGNPKPGRVSHQFSVKPIAAHLEKIMKKPVKVASDSAGFYAATLVSKMNSGDIVMLENIRFESGEKENSKRLAKKLAELVDIYVNDSFGADHRRHASVAAIKQYLPSYAGLLLEDEICNLKQALHPKHPLVVVIGGVKLETKIPLIKKFDSIADKILVGGALANNFFAARGYEIGKSIADKKSINLAKKITRDNIILPIDVITGTKERVWKTRVKKLDQVGKDDYIFDIGPQTINLYARLIKKANTILWNGPMGMFEDKHYQYGTLAVGRVLAARSTGQAFGIAGGGETIAALKMTKMIEHVDWVSTGGGAMLTYLSGGIMPGLKGLV